jgi:hypothetical protein
VTYEIVVVLRSDPTPPPIAAAIARPDVPVERSAYDIPGFASSPSAERPLSFPLIRLIDPDRNPEDRPDAAAAPAKPGTAATPAAKKTPSTAPADASTKAAPAETKVAKLTPPDASLTDAPPPPTAAPEAGQWRVVPTAAASYFNLGGHIDSNGVVDNLANSHLRDALKAHSRFGQLPPDIKTHILTQNINLPKIAPYRVLLGMDDRILEQEQAIKFVRVR